MKPRMVSGRIVDLAAYRARLRRMAVDARKEKEVAKRDLISSLVDWYDQKVNGWEKTRRNLEAEAGILQQSGDPDEEERQRSIIANYIDHLKLFGRLLYVFQAIKVIQTEGQGWEKDPEATQAVFDLILDNLWEK